MENVLSISNREDESGINVSKPAHSEQEQASTIVTVDQGKIYVAKEREPMPVNLRFALMFTQAGISFAVVAICAYVISQTPENQNQKAVA